MLIEIDDVVSYLINKNLEGFDIFKALGDGISMGDVDEKYKTYIFHGFFTTNNEKFWDIVFDKYNMLHRKPVDKEILESIRRLVDNGKICS